MNWLQTNGDIYLPVVVEGGTRVFAFWRDVRRGLPANTHIHPMPEQCCVSVAQRTNVPALGKRLLFAGSLHSQQTHSMSNPAL